MFPLPLSDTTRVRYGTLPWVTMGLIAVNVLLWLYSHWLNEAALLVFGTVPYTVRMQQGIGAFSLITSTFLHGDLFHILGNMIFLWAFGRRIEDACGHARYLLFYLLAGLLAGVASVFIRGGNLFDQYVPGIGASGAIAGVMGAYLILFPGTRITTIIVLGIIPVPIRLKIPALIYLVWWLVQQVIPGLAIIQGENPGYTTDFIAHLAGFFAGLLIFLFVRKDLLYRYVTGSRL